MEQHMKYAFQAIIFLGLAFTLQAQANPTSDASSESKQSINWASEKDISKHIEFRLEKEYGEVTYGPNFAPSDTKLSDHFSEIYLTRLIDHKGADHYALYITAQYNDTDWRSYKGAVNKQGNKLSLVTLSKNENVCENTSCRYEERLAIPLSFLYFFDGATMGLDVTLSGSRTNQINIPSAYFKAMMNSIPQESLYDEL
jgi:hypothetical protein